MKLLVIDNRLHRHPFHYDLLSDTIPDIKIVENIEEEELRNSDYDIIIVHRNNPELDVIEQNKDIGKLRIIFSGNLIHYQHNEIGHYVPFNQYEEMVKLIISNFQQNLEKIK
jgi:hypothetical protein|tara:strand:- start:1039 stop:1374 length:336 start_codon:yes stop_codon:yes gene_type:complete